MSISYEVLLAAFNRKSKKGEVACPWPEEAHFADSQHVACTLQLGTLLETESLKESVECEFLKNHHKKSEMDLLLGIFER